jgi:hypothetical protein
VLEAGDRRVSRLDLPPLYANADVFESLVRDGYIARQLRPYVCVAVALDWLALVLLGSAARRPRLGLPGMAVALVWLLSSAWHGLVWVITMIFAG